MRRVGRRLGLNLGDHDHPGPRRGSLPRFWRLGCHFIVRSRLISLNGDFEEVKLAIHLTPYPRRLSEKGIQDRSTSNFCISFALNSCIFYIDYVVRNEERLLLKVSFCEDAESIHIYAILEACQRKASSS
jgi:hypothetical protein